MFVCLFFSSCAVKIGEFENLNVSAASKVLRLTMNASSNLMRHNDLDMYHIPSDLLSASQNKDGARHL